MRETNLYDQVRLKLCDEIYFGQYQDGDRLPSERELMERLDVSRVTVRKSLELLEEDRLISREVGKGTSVTYHNFGNANELDMIVLIAPSRNPFFSEFIGRFQNYAAREDSLILYVEKPMQEGLEDCLYRLYKRGLRNAVVWLEDMEADQKKLCRLRALGMNLVFFDTDKGIPYADCVSLDNAHAVRTLLEKLREAGSMDPVYIGWDLEQVYSIRTREAVFRTQQGKQARCVRLPWKGQAVEMVRDTLRGLSTDADGEKKALSNIPAVLCADAECGRIAAGIVREERLNIRVAMVDEILPSEACDGLMMYAQDLHTSVQRIYQRLKEQCKKAAAWKATLCQIRGNYEVSSGPLLHV